MNRSAAAAPAPAPRAVVSSSPGRAEKLPTAPGLARLLRGKSGSRSRGRSSLARSSPMFVSSSRSVGTSSSSRGAAAAEGEPSSPKVTCIGQVRIRNKKIKSKPSMSDKSKADYQEEQRRRRPMVRCHCLERALLCNIFARKRSSGRPRRPLWRRWSLSFRSEGESSYQPGTSLEREEAHLAYPPPGTATGGAESDGECGESEETEEEEEEEEEETRVFMPSATAPPPKNALLLMRCRSAPHNRSSSLATRFAVSPLPAPEASTVEEPEKSEASGGGLGDEESRGSSKDGRMESESESEYFSSSPSRPPLVLTRCKSEPAKTAEKLLVPEEAAAYFIWNSGSDNAGKQRRLALVQEEELPTPPLPG